MEHDQKSDFEWLRLAAYLCGTASADDRVQVERWLDADPSRRRELAQLQQAWTTGPSDPIPAADLRQMWGAIAAATRISATPTFERGTHNGDHTHAPGTTARADVPPTSATPRQRDVGSRLSRPGLGAPRMSSATVWYRSRPWIATAIGAFAVALTFLALPAVRTPLWLRSAERIDRTYAAARGQRMAVELDDGSRLLLAPETRVRYSVDASGARTVTLDGEVLFTVMSRAQRPFIVRTGAVVTRVLGTTFDVRHYPGDRATRVAVTSGRVSSGGHMTPVVLAAGAVGHLTDSSATVSAAADADRAVAWTQGRLVFDDTPVAEVLATFSRWYGYEFRLADTTLASRHVSGAFSTDAPAEAMNAIKTVLGVTMAFDGNVVTLRPKGSGTETQGTSRPRKRDLLRNFEPEVGK